jgi:SAM-dependent methyltransferase
MSCRICLAPTRQILDLGESPPANSLKVSPDQFQESYPLVLEWCESCDNIQLRDTLSAEDLYRDYLYVTPESESLAEHYDALIAHLERTGILTSDSVVVEPGSNIGHFLRHLAPRVRSVLGIDPATEIAEMANAAGIPTICDFFTPEVAARIASERGPADLVVARHCLAHNETPHPMLSAARALLGKEGSLVIENAYVLNTIENNEFDQVYHEHMFYFSVRSMKVLLGLHDLQLVDAFTSPVHGGSIIFIAKPGTRASVAPSIALFDEREVRSLNLQTLGGLAEKAETVRRTLKALVDDVIEGGATVDSYGATAKGNTLLNYVGLTSREIRRCVDSTPLKQGRFLPKSNIPVISEEAASAEPPDFYLLTAWNYRDEIIAKVRGGGNRVSKFIVPIPAPYIVGHGEPMVQ